MRYLWLALLLLPASAQARPTNRITLTNLVSASDCSGSNYGGCNFTPHTFMDGLDGADVAKLLEDDCEAASGCIIDCGGQTVENIAVDITSTAADTVHGRNGGTYTSSSFPNGVVFDHCVFKAHIPMSYEPNAKLSGFYIRTDIFPLGGGKFEMVNSDCDGQSNLQPSWQHADSLGAYDHYGDVTLNSCVYMDDQTTGLFAGVYFRNNHIHHWLGAGIRIEQAAVGAITDNEVNNIGCYNDFSEAIVCNSASGPNFTTVKYAANTIDPSDDLPITCCTGLGTGTCNEADGWVAGNYPTGQAVAGEVECGCDSATETSTCYGWNLETEQNAPSTHSPGYKVAAGYGIDVQSSRILVARNNVHHTTKYGILSGVGSAAVVASAGETFMRTFGSYNRLWKNVVGMMVGTHGGNTTYLRNVCESAGLNGNISSSTSCFEMNGATRLVELIENQVDASYGPAIHDSGWMAVQGINPWRLYKDNVIHGSSIWATTNPTGAWDVSVRIYQSDASSDCSDPYRVGPTPVQFIGNTIDNTNTGYSPLMIGYGADQTCASTKIDPLIMSGGSIQGSGWTTHRADIGDIQAYNISATGVTLLDNAIDGTLRWISGSTGTCSGRLGTGAFVDNSGNSIGTCP